MEESAQPADPILLILTQLMEALLAPHEEPASKLYFITFLARVIWRSCGRRWQSRLVNSISLPF